MNSNKNYARPGSRTISSLSLVNITFRNLHQARPANFEFGSVDPDSIYGSTGSISYDTRIQIEQIRIRHTDPNGTRFRLSSLDPV